ncbi:MAG TPA: cyclophilin-like fold protein [Blastocatellia bacterium]|nr:cyclophilin-like fold protein [Blastocatellia bacterium]
MSNTEVERMFLKLPFIKREKPAHKKLMFLALALMMCLNQIACGAGKDTVGSTPPAQTNEVANKQAKDMKIRIKIGGKVVTAILNDNQTARDFVSLLPQTLTLEDYAGTEKISDLPKRLSTKGAPSGSDPAVGDIAYYAPWGNLAIFYRDFGYSSGLVILGKIDGGMEAFNAPGSVKATIELVK